MRFRILHYTTVDSTNNLALSFAREGVQEGTVVVAEYQTHGRGRFKRRWTSPRGENLLFSIVLRPKFESSRAPMLTHLAAQSVAEVLKREFQLPLKLKRPNDVVVGGRKIAGILTESRPYYQCLEYVVVGIGLNVNSRRRKLVKKATSIYDETSKKAEKQRLLLQMLEAFRIKYELLNSKASYTKKAENKEIFQHA